jgi:hypothetical protein
MNSNQKKTVPKIIINLSQLELNGIYIYQSYLLSFF